MGKGAGQCDREPLGLVLGGEPTAGERATPAKRKRGPLPYWTEERIETTLREFLEGRTYWPPIREFKAAGLGGLQQRIKKDAAVDRWMEHFGLADPRYDDLNDRVPFLGDTAKRLLQAVGENQGPFADLPSDSIPVSEPEMRMLLAVHTHRQVTSTVGGLGMDMGTTDNGACSLLQMVRDKGLIDERRHPDRAVHWIRTLTEQGEVLVKRFLLAQLKADMTDPDHGAADRPVNQHFPLDSHGEAAQAAANASSM